MPVSINRAATTRCALAEPLPKRLIKSHSSQCNRYVAVNRTNAYDFGREYFFFVKRIFERRLCLMVHHWQGPLSSRSDVAMLPIRFVTRQTVSSVTTRGKKPDVTSKMSVCTISETATPHRMGAALTYARRYALFTLVGIAGEDDIDAPDLKAPMPPASAAAKPAPNEHGRLSGGQGHSPQQIPGRRGAKVALNPAKPILGAEASAILREKGAQLSAEPVEPAVDPTVALAPCFLRLANLPNYALDRLNRYKGTLWRQAGQILFALDALDRRKPADRRRPFRVGRRQELQLYDPEDY